MLRFAIAFGVVAFFIVGAIFIASEDCRTALASSGDAVLAQRDPSPKPSPSIGIFPNNGDVGTVLHPGSVAFDKEARSYTVVGSGENMWSTKDAFHYVWKKVSGDVALTADISFLDEGQEPHRKACLVVRQSLDADSACVDAAFYSLRLT